jgi:shikimate dehydrogenase
VTDGSGTRLAVLGSPISHSKSPTIHRAAYAALGLDWQYDGIEIDGPRLEAFVESRDKSWRGLSLTMPLKRDIVPLLTWRDPVVDLVGGANTVLFDAAGVRGFNTDVMGVERSFREADVTALDSVHVLGGGATAASVIAGVARLGASRVLVSARTPDRAQPLVALGAALGVDVTIRSWGDLDSSMPTPDAVVSTVPGGQNDLSFPEAVRASAVLFDVSYDPWPSTAAIEWADAGGVVISGLDLLINQAVGQIRIFVSGDPTVPLELEHAVVAAMRAAATMGG